MSNVSPTLQAIREAAAPTPAVKPATPPGPPAAPPPEQGSADIVDIYTVYQSVSTEKDHADLAAAVEEYDMLKATLSDMELPHLAADARKKIEAAGVETCDDACLRTVFLARMCTHEQVNQRTYEIDGRINHHLTKRGEPIVRRIQTAALAELDKLFPPPPSADLAVAERFGLPAPSPWTRLYRSLRIARDAIAADMEKPVDLTRSSERRAYFQRFVAKTL